jgi:hypothetical protein
MNEIVDFDDFLNRYKQEALLIDLKKEQLLAYEILERQKIKLSRVKFESEIDNVLKFCKDAIEQTEEMLITAFLNEHYKYTYKSGKPFFLSQMKAYLEYLSLFDAASVLKKQIKKRNELTEDIIDAPVLALFCNLLSITGIDPKDEAESVETFCKRICEKYDFIYRDRVRQNFNGSNTKDKRKKLIKNILPSVDKKIKDKIQSYLDNKYPPKENLYA